MFPLWEALLNPRPITSEADYESAIKEISAFFENQPAPGTPDAARFDLLANLIEAACEDIHGPMAS